MTIKNEHQRKLLTTFIIGGIVIIAAVIYVCSFNSYLKEDISKTHQASADNAENVTASLNISAAWLLNDADVFFILNSYTDYDVLRTGTAQSSVQMITTLVDAEEIFFLRKNEGVIYSSNRMFPVDINEFSWDTAELKDMALRYCAEDTNAFFAADNEIYYICNNDRNTAVLYSFKKNNIRKKLFADSEKSFVYYNGTFLCANDSENIQPKLNIEKYKGNGNVFFDGMRMYICDKYSYLAYVTVIDYKTLFVSLFKNTFYIYAIILLIIIAAYFVTRYIIGTMEKNNDDSEKFYGQELMDRAILKLFLNNSISLKDSELLGSMFKASVTPVMFYIDTGSEEYTENERWAVTYGVCNILTELFDKSKFVCYSLCIGVGLVSEKNIDAIVSILSDAQTFIKRNLKVGICFIVGRTYPTVGEAVLRLNKPTEMIENIYLCSDERIVCIADAARSDEWQKKSDTIYNNILRFVKLGDAAATSEELLSLAQLAGSYNAFEVRSFVIRLFLDIFNIVKARHSDWQQYEMFNEFVACQTLGEAIGYIKNILADTGASKQNIDDIFRMHVEAAIEQYYNVPDFNLAYLAEIVNMNKTYLGRKFVSVFNENFSQYIAEYRINKACAMLKNVTIKVEDIAVACGFSSASYFIKIFKKYKGITPIEYRETMKEENK